MIGRQALLSLQSSKNAQAFGFVDRVGEVSRRTDRPHQAKVIGLSFGQVQGEINLMFSGRDGFVG